MEDLRIYYPIYDTKTKVEKSHVNPFEEFISYSIDKHYRDYENVSVTIRDLCMMTQESEMSEFFSKNIQNCGILNYKCLTDNGAWEISFSVYIDNKFICFIELKRASYIVGERGDNYSIKLHYKDNHLFDFLVTEYADTPYYLFNEIPETKQGVRILLSIVKMFGHFGEYAKFRMFNQIKPNGIYPLLKRKLNIDDDDKEQFLNVHYGVTDAIVVYCPHKGKMNDFNEIKTKRVSYNTYASDIEEFIKDIRHEN
jgi:hypothetical protein